MHSNGLVSFPPKTDAIHALDALVANITGSSFGVPHYATIEEQAVAYFYFIIKNHPFIDGNKRTATLSFLVLCALNNLNRDDDLNLDALAIYLEQTPQHADHQKVISDVAKALFV